MTNGGQDDGDPILDLREILVEEDEPLVPVDVDEHAVSESSAVAPPPKAPPSSSPAPPPLPPRRAGSSRAAARTEPSPFGAVANVPPPSPRFAGDPFQEPPEPRLPRGLPEEKLEYFRTVLKQKQETLARARALYTEREQEGEQLREAAHVLKLQLESVLPELEQLRELPVRLQEMTELYERARTEAERGNARAEQAEAKAASFEADFESVVEERKLLSKALAEVEVQIPALTEKAEEERSSRAALADELVDLKESLKIAEERVAELEAKKSEVEGDLEATNEQYQAVSSENERLSTELDRISEELKTVVAEREASIAERDVSRGDIEALNARIRDLELEVTTAGAHAQDQARRAAHEAQEQARRTVQEAQEQARHAVEKVHEQGRHAQEQARRAVQEAQARAEAAHGEVEQLKSQVSRLQSEKAQSKAQADQHTKKLKEELTASTQRKITELQTLLMLEEEKRSEMESRALDAEGKAEALSRQIASLEGQVGAARSEQAGTRKLRDELATTNRRAVELQTLLQKERRERDALDKRAASAESNKEELQDRIEALEATIARMRSDSEPAKAAPGSGSPELIAERDKLKADVASMKKKLVAAENAMEAAASLKAKVARLEAQLKGKK